MIDVVALVRGELEAVAPDVLVARAIARSSWIDGLARDEGLVVVAVGKAATLMYEGAARVLGSRIRAAGVVCPEGARAPSSRPGLNTWTAPHPLPDVRSVRAARGVLSLVSRAAGPVLVLVSGGASSLVAWPVSGLSLEKKRHVVSSLLASGAPIEDVNLVRRHLSRVKGGGILRAAYPRPVHTFVVSDVVRGRASAVGSGPSIPSPRGLRAARAAAHRWLGAGAAALPFTACVGPRDPEALHAKYTLLISPEAFARRVEQALSREGLVVAPRSVAEERIGGIDQLARGLLKAAGDLAEGAAVAMAAEPTVRLPAGTRGRGGRASHLALMLGPKLPRGVRALCLATDGVDGTSGHAGALVRRELFSGRAREVRASLTAYDAGAFVASVGASVVIPSGHNLTDLVVLVRDC